MTIKLITKDGKCVELKVRNKSTKRMRCCVYEGDSKEKLIKEYPSMLALSVDLGFGNGALSSYFYYAKSNTIYLPNKNITIERFPA